MCHKILCFSYVECQIACLCGAKRLYFYRIAVALRMECVDLSDTKDGGKMSGAVALRMECVDLSFRLYRRYYGNGSSHSS